MKSNDILKKLSKTTVIRMETNRHHCISPEIDIKINLK